MGRRTNPISTRLGGLLNWPSNVSHPFLQKYVKHIFQNTITSTPNIRSSTSKIYINLTVFQLQSPIPAIRSLDFRGADLKNAFDRIESRQQDLLHFHEYYRKEFKGLKFKTLTEAAKKDGVLAGLHIYRDTDIELKVNVINNPLLNAEIMSQVCADAMQEGVPLSRVFKTFLSSMA